MKIQHGPRTFSKTRSWCTKARFGLIHRRLLFTCWNACCKLNPHLRTIGGLVDTKKKTHKRARILLRHKISEHNCDTTATPGRAMNKNAAAVVEDTINSHEALGKYALDVFAFIVVDRKANTVNYDPLRLQHFCVAPRGPGGRSSVQCQ